MKDRTHRQKVARIPDGVHAWEYFQVYSPSEGPTECLTVARLRSFISPHSRLGSHGTDGAILYVTLVGTQWSPLKSVNVMFFPVHRIAHVPASVSILQKIFRYPTPSADCNSLKIV